MCFHKDRITVLLGAGVPLGLKSKNNFIPSTKNITNEVLNKSYPLFDPKTRKSIPGTLIKDIFVHSCNCFHPAPLNPNNPDSAAIVHFEILFYILEMLETFDRSWRSTTVSKYTNKFAPFVNSSFSFNSHELFPAYRHLINTIIESVRKYDDLFTSEENDWYRNFWLRNKKGWDLFNLNYDTTVEQSLGVYEDGYEEIEDQKGFQRFSIIKLLENKGHLSTINHMHGCLLYGVDRYENRNHDVFDFDHQDLYKWPDVDTAYARWSSTTSSSGTAQDGSVIVQGPIITGLAKTDKVTCLPYDGYRNNFYSSIIKNKSLLIAGYSFSDPYINQMFYRMFQAHRDNTRVVLIDYWNLNGFFKENEAADVNDCLTDENLSPRIIDHYFSFDYGNDEMLLFIKRVAHFDMDIWEHFDRLSLSGPMISDNGCLMLFVGGFKDALENHGDEIMDFLRP